MLHEIRISDDELRLTVSFLQQLSDLMSNHGCNDFDLCKFFPERSDRDALVMSFHDRNGDPEEYVDNDESKGVDYRLQDWILADMLAERFRDILESER